MADRGEVDADLVRATRLEPRQRESVGREVLDHLEMSACIPRAGSLHRPLCSLLPVPAEWGVDRPGAATQPPLHQGGVLAHDLPGLDHPRELALGFVVASHEHQAGGVLVQAVDDPRPAALSAGGDALQQVHQRLALVRRRRMDHEAGRLLDHGQVVVEVDDETLGLGLHESLPRPSERSTSKSSSSTPTTIATSARLKVGQSGTLMKSVTAPSRTLSARFPSAPPISRAAGSQTSHPLPPRKARKTRNPSRTRIVTPMKTAEMSPPIPNATPSLRTFSKARNGSTSTRSPRVTRDVASAFVP